MKVSCLEDLKVYDIEVRPTKFNKEKLPRSVIGLDTETSKTGEAVLIADGNGRYEKINSFKQIAEFMLYSGYKKTINFFFNLSFDTNALISWLPEKNMLDLADFNYTIYKKIGIRIKPNKELKLFYIKKGKPYRTVKFYDIANFYKIGSLEETYNQTFKNKKNYKKLIDASKKEFSYESLKYIDIAYCIQDAKACQKLADYLHKATSEFCRMNNYLSPASISKTIRKINLKQPYRFTKSHVQDMALRSCAGGRIEVSQIGYFPKVFLYDIVSAYPSILINLESIGSERRKSPDYIPESIYSFFKIDVDIPNDYIIAPLKFLLKKTGLLGYPTGTLKNCYVAKSTLELLMEYDIRFDILEGSHILDTNERIPKPFSFIKPIFEKRVEYKKDHDPRQLPLKLALNSLWGGCIETTKKYKMLKKWTNDLESDPKNHLREIGNDMLLAVPETYAGMFFNPVYGAEVTAQIRNEIFRKCYKYQENVIGIATDGILFDKKINNHFDINKYKLGCWDKSKSLHGVVNGNGIYSFSSKNGEEIIYKFRGFGKINIMDIINKEKIINNNNMSYYFDNNNINYLYDNKSKTAYIINENNITYIKKSPFKLKESKSNYKNLNIFRDKEKAFSLNFDKKRVWDRKVNNFGDLLENQIGSKPIQIKH